MKVVRIQRFLTCREKQDLFRKKNPNLISSLDTSFCFFLFFFNETNLHADGQVDPGSEGSADSARRQAEVFEELGEGLRQGQAGALLGDHHAAPHARQIHTPRLDTHTALSVTDGYLFYYYLSCWYQEALWQHSANSGRTLTFSISVWVPRPLVHSSMTE